jgi:hypothetical protein
MLQLQVIKINSSGELVKSWQYFLLGKGYFIGIVNGIFDENTKNATIEFQKTHRLQPDGVVGNRSYGVAMQLGFEGAKETDTSIQSSNWPTKPDFLPLVTNSQRQGIFGKIIFQHEPKPGNYENIRITNDWERKNIVAIEVTQLKNIKGSSKVFFHKLAANQLIKLWNDWEREGLLHHVLTWEGSYVPRFVRGSTSSLSNHAFGSAFDINFSWNQLGVTPALVGQKGCVRELVEIANQNGFYWGGHFRKLDGMHFDIAKLL